MTLPDPPHSDSSRCASGADDSGRDAFLRSPLEQPPLWARLYESIRDIAFPPRLPLLELTSTPVAASDRMSCRANPWAVGSSAAINGAILIVVILLALRTPPQPFSDPHTPGATQLDDLSNLASRAARLARGGSGGGASSLTDPPAGQPPKFEPVPLAPPMMPIVANPILTVDSSVPILPDIRLPDDTSMPNIGVHKSISVVPDANGPGRAAGIGSGGRDGIGPGDGPGYDLGHGVGLFRPGIDGVSAPVPLVTPDAEFSDEARRQKYQGVCTLSVIVDAQGLVKDVRVVSPLGMGLDEKAKEAVWKYRFRPAMRNGKPVPVLITVRVDFRLY